MSNETSKETQERMSEVASREEENKKDNEHDENKTQQEEEEEGERKGNEARTTKPKKEDDGDECPICLEILPNDITKFARMACCGNGIHIHCDKDLTSMKMGRTCPLCRAKTPSSQEEVVKQLQPWVKKKKAWAQSYMAQMYREGTGVKQIVHDGKTIVRTSSTAGKYSRDIRTR
jgi:hypothetical protein